MNSSEHQVQPNRISPTALAVADAARLLSAVSGGTITPEMLHADVACGAPTNPDGTLNLVHYAAWLLKARSHRED